MQFACARCMGIAFKAEVLCNFPWISGGFFFSTITLGSICTFAFILPNPFGWIAIAYSNRYTRSRSAPVCERSLWAGVTLLSVFGAKIKQRTELSALLWSLQGDGIRRSRKLGSPVLACLPVQGEPSDHSRSVQNIREGRREGIFRKRI